MGSTKEFKTLKEQVELLESRGLRIKNAEKAMEVLGKYNYFDVVNGFESLFLKDKVNKRYEGIYFEDLQKVYEFDMKIKMEVLRAIFDIESRLRTSIAYHFSEKYCKGPSCIMEYTNKSNYIKPPSADRYMCNKFKYFDLFQQQQIGKKGTVKKKSYVEGLKEYKPYIDNYNDPPFWVVIKTLPLGSLYFLFTFLDVDIKKSVLSDFGLDYKDCDAFIEALFVIKEARNDCAHLELITRFRLKKVKGRIEYKKLMKRVNITKGTLNFMDVTKILGWLGTNKAIKREILLFAMRMKLRKRSLITNKLLGKMGRKNIYKWIKI